MLLLLLLLLLHTLSRYKFFLLSSPVLDRKLLFLRRIYFFISFCRNAVLIKMQGSSCLPTKVISQIVRTELNFLIYLLLYTEWRNLFTEADEGKSQNIFQINPKRNLKSEKNIANINVFWKSFLNNLSNLKYSCKSQYNYWIHKYFFY